MPPKERKKKKKESKSMANSSGSNQQSYVDDNSPQGLQEQEFADKVAKSKVTEKEQEWANKITASDEDEFGDFQSASVQASDEDEFGDFQSASVQAKDEDDWADFDSEEAMNVVNVGIGEHKVASSKEKLFTKDLADCVAVVGYTDTGEAAMYHVNIPAQCYCVADEQDWEENLEQMAAEYAKVKGALEKAVSKGALSYQFIVGSTWEYVSKNPKAYKNGKKWIQMMNSMFQTVFGGTYKGSNSMATWNPLTKELTPG